MKYIDRARKEQIAEQLKITLERLQRIQTWLHGFEAGSKTAVSVSNFFPVNAMTVGFMNLSIKNALDALDGSEGGLPKKKKRKAKKKA